MTPPAIFHPSLLLGMHGYVGSGKDTFAARLTSEHGFQRIALADAIRDIMYTLNPWVTVEDSFFRLRDIVDSFGWEEAKRAPRFNMEVRRLLQVMGTEVGREMFGDSVWLDLAERKFSSERIVITDIRFTNEADWLRALGGHVVVVTRPGCGPVNDHPSERSMPGDFEIANDSTLDALNAVADSLVDALVSRERI